MKNLLKSLLIKILITWYKFAGPPRILRFRSSINIKILKAFGAKIHDEQRGIFPPIIMHGSRECYKRLTVGKIA
jgi:hypothetical protein